jgi:hypothetical protein
MKTTTFQLLPTTTYGTPSGNYDGSSEDFAGDAQKAANYYVSTGGLQTVAVFLSGFVGNIVLQASLDSSPTSDANWFDVDRLEYTSSTTSNFSRNITGNFTWLRAKVTDFQAGSIEKIQMSY